MEHFSLQEILEFIDSNEILAYDVESTGLNVRKDRVMGFGISNATTGYYIPILKYVVEHDSVVHSHISEDDIDHILSKLANKKLLMFNASFDARITKNYLGIDLLSTLHTDVLLLKHTCDEEFPFGLKEIATKLWGHDVKKEKEEMLASVKANGGSAKEYFKADSSLLAKYCISDCLLTFRMYLHYRPILDAEGLTTFFYDDEVMPLLREVTIPMMDEGVCLDMPKLHTTLKEINVDLATLENDIKNDIKPYLGCFTDWFRNKEYSFKATGRTGKRFKTAGHGSFTMVQEALMLEDYPNGAFNMLSKHHLKKLFFDELHCKPLSTTPTGLPQVDEEFLTSIVGLYPFVSSIIAYNKLTKLKGTYIENLINDSENGIYYPEFMQHRTVSGRYAGNLQQLPRPFDIQDEHKYHPMVFRYNNRIREFIVPAPDCKLVSADYEQLEPSIFAHASNDPALQEIFIKGTDFYSTGAIFTEGLLGVSADKSATNYLGKVSKQHRQRAKIYMLGIAYGMTGYKLKFEIGGTDEEADALVARYWSAFPGLAAWVRTSKEQVKRDGKISTQSGRVRHLERVRTLYRKYGLDIENDLSLWKTYNHNTITYKQAKLDRREFKNLINNAINFQIQGLAASIVSRASIEVARYLKKNGLKSKIVMSVHDEIVLNVSASELDTVPNMVKDKMENIVKLTVPLRTVPQIGNSFRECK